MFANRYERNEYFEALATLKEHYQMLPAADQPDPKGDKGWEPRDYYLLEKETQGPPSAEHILNNDHEADGA